VTKPVLIAPSLLSADFSILGEQIKACETGGADWIHCDIMDGHFVPNLTFGPFIVAAAKKVTHLPLDVHLMIEHADQYIPEFIKAGASIVTVHQEAVYHLHRSVSLIRSLGAQPGVSINPGTPVSTLEEILPFIDLVLIMSVNPGFGGQEFIPTIPEKIKKLRRMADQLNPGLLIEVDGGITPQTIGKVTEAGANVMVAGSAVFKYKIPGEGISLLRKGISELL